LSAYFGRKFITLSVHLCLQHICCDAAHHGGLSVIADTCYNWPSVLELLQRGLVPPKEKNCGKLKQVFTVQMPFLSSSQQCHHWRAD